VVLIGHAGHEEVEGTLGEAPNQTVLVQTADEVTELEVAAPARVSYLTQTTLAVDETTEIVEALRARFPALRGPASDDICYATTNRQDALTAIAQESDMVLVIGSTNSSNSVRLVELAHRHGTPSYLIDDPGDIRPEWLDGVRVLGLTAGASAGRGRHRRPGRARAGHRRRTRDHPRDCPLHLALHGSAIMSLLGRTTGPADPTGLSTATFKES
jgi:4-hydroxy-3-methylbut-2-enyl diphosphate reductase